MKFVSVRPLGTFKRTLNEFMVEDYRLKMDDTWKYVSIIDLHIGIATYPTWVPECVIKLSSKLVQQSFIWFIILM